MNKHGVIVTSNVSRQALFTVTVSGGRSESQYDYRAESGIGSAQAWELIVSNVCSAGQAVSIYRAFSVGSNN